VAAAVVVVKAAAAEEVARDQEEAAAEARDRVAVAAVEEAPDRAENVSARIAEKRYNTNRASPALRCSAPNADPR